MQTVRDWLLVALSQLAFSLQFRLFQTKIRLYPFCSPPCSSARPPSHPDESSSSPIPLGPYPKIQDSSKPSPSSVTSAAPSYAICTKNRADGVPRRSWITSPRFLRRVRWSSIPASQPPQRNPPHPSPNSSSSEIDS